MYLFKSYFLNKRVPENLEDVSKYPNLFAELIADNWSDDDLAKLAGQNILRVLSDVEKVCFKIIFFSPSKKLFISSKSIRSPLKIGNLMIMLYHKRI